MKVAIITFPGSNCDRDLALAFQRSGASVVRVWHKDPVLPAGLDLIGIPGGFSFGDYLRCGAIAAQSPIMHAVQAFVRRGGYAIGICNGFQVLTEAGLLPGALMRNSGLKFVCKTVGLRVATTSSPFTSGWSRGDSIALPIAHHDGNYTIDSKELDRLRDEDRIAFTYSQNPNGSAGDIAGVLSENRRVLGMMPHPERALDPVQGSADGSVLFRSLGAALALV